MFPHKNIAIKVKEVLDEMSQISNYQMSCYGYNYLCFTHKTSLKRDYRTR